MTSTTTSSLSEAARHHILALADDEHIIGSRHANWIGMGPFLEEDLAFCSIAQDELGHSLALFELLMPASEIDTFALIRQVDEYRSCALAEIACDTWDLALVRHWLYDTAEDLRWANLEGSCVLELAQLATQARRDERFHLEHAEMFMTRVAADPAARERVENALDDVLAFAASLWAPAELESEALSEQVMAASSAELAQRWAASIAEQLSRFGLDADLSSLETVPSEQARYSRVPGFGEFHRSLGEVISLDTTAIW